MKLTFAYSPCPNDTFMFEPLVSGKIDTEGLQFDIHLADVEVLNKSATENKFDITKLSFNAYTKLTNSYQLLNSGSALGRKCGPLLIAKRTLDLDQIERNWEDPYPFNLKSINKICSLSSNIHHKATSWQWRPLPN